MGVRGQRHALSALTPGKDRVPIEQEAVWAPGPVLTGAENLLPYTGPKILLYPFLSIMFNCFLSLFVSVQVSDEYVKVLSIVVFFGLNFSFFDMFFFQKIVACAIIYWTACDEL